ncbi:adenine nucleotide alpha hydrolases-like protein [Hypoxylon sp. NC0597]|nr:adenine nucleotide alpha hydrolases-like protein [Hypoxylon sp. NC0597]
MATDGPLDVVALVSGGKDSFYSILHCLANGHRVVALANLHPPSRVATANTDTTTPTSRAEVKDRLRAGAGNVTNTTSTTIRISPGDDVFSHQQHGSLSVPRVDNNGDEEDEVDLNSFMYQTVGHQVIPLYAKATGLPLFRQPILGTAIDSGISYRDPDGQHPEEDETESLIPLLRAVLKAHPEINALCTGAILSTYQRTRIESVALRLGLVPLAYLWQYPELPLSSSSTNPSSPPTKPVGADKDDGQLLRDMATAGLEARIVKVASAGLDEGFLWENVASETTVSRIRQALRRFGSAGSRGAVLGEGGEFETLVIDGPSELFKGRIIVRDEDRRIVHEGGGSAWLNIRQAKVETKTDREIARQAPDLNIRIPGLFDPVFGSVLYSLLNEKPRDDVVLPQSLSSLLRLELAPSSSNSQDWYFVGNPGGVENQTAQVVDGIRQRLHQDSLPATAITSSVIVLRQMADFPTVNRLYGALFQEPNPPARVTISCGDLLLPPEANIGVLLTVQSHLKKEDRRGLHVQSRSYWAPANIGPYSQAGAYPLFASDESRSHHDGADSASPLAVSVAGQIPLVPASMSLPPVQPDGGSILPFQVTLALQHLWRVGTEMQVQWWSSAVAYFPHSPSLADAKSNALLASSAWNAVHDYSFSSTIDTAKDLDPWDRKYNPTYMTYGDASDDITSRPALPDWEVLKDFDPDADADAEGGGVMQRPLPFVFSAEVEELPRSAGVEWHAHLGFANMGSGSIRLCFEVSGGGGSSDHISLHHVVAESSFGTVFVQTIAVYKGTKAPFSFVDAMDCTILAVKRSLGKMVSGQDDLVISATIKAKLTYVTEVFVFPEDISSLLEKGAIIPCRSLWDSLGNSLDMVSIFETRWVKVN